jgi:putative ATPase
MTGEGESMEPLAARLRPQNLDEYIGQEHLVGVGKPLRNAVEQKHLFSFILWGPPGVGKTTLARIYANALGAEFHELSAVSAGKEDIKKIIASGVMPGSDPASRRNPNLDSGSKAGITRPRVLFLDEIHRFNKAQQDFLLPYVESGQLTLIGATTENPSFEVIPALLSRCRVFTLKELNDAQMREVIERAVSAQNPHPPSGHLPPEGEEKFFSPSGGDVSAPETERVRMDSDAIGWLVSMANGDARQAITMLENTSKLYDEITVDTLKETLQSKHLRYDKAGEEHYNTISAFIKSMRASQPDAALYYLARMVEAGEDPLFIARRMVIFASEDIGLAQPTALVVANAVFQACQSIGYPECAINLAHGVAYLAQCKKDRSAYDALRSAQADVKQQGNLPIPLNIRNAPTKLMKDLDYGKGYKMYSEESYLPDALKGKKYLSSSRGEL